MVRVLDALILFFSRSPPRRAVVYSNQPLVKHIRERLVARYGPLTYQKSGRVDAPVKKQSRVIVNNIFETTARLRQGLLSRISCELRYPDTSVPSSVRSNNGVFC